MKLRSNLLHYPLLMMLLLAAFAHPPMSRAMPDASDPLPSWQEGPHKQRIVDFVERVTKANTRDFVPPKDRIATFDNDGTLWCEYPLYVQGVFVLDRARELAAQDPALKSKPAFQKLLADNDPMDMTEQEIAELIAATHAGMSPEEFLSTARSWLAAAKHPRFDRLYTDCIYQPQLELLDYLRSNGFQVYIVSGGGIDFIRAFADPTYGVARHQVIGSSTKTRFDMKDGKGSLTKLPSINSVDDHAGKPVNINLHVGQRPILAFGNSDGDLEMLAYTAANQYPTLQLLVHHDDAAREYAYDRQSKIGQLDKAWDDAKKFDWIVVSMKDDWKTVFPKLNQKSAPAAETP